MTRAPVTGHLRRLLLAGLLTTPAAVAAAWAWFTRGLPSYDDPPRGPYAQECEQAQRRLRERRQGTRYG